MVGVLERATVTRARERADDLARALDTNLLLGNVRGVLDLICEDAEDAALLLSEQDPVSSVAPQIDRIRRALDLIESTLRFMEGATA